MRMNTDIKEFQRERLSARPTGPSWWPASNRPYQPRWERYYYVPTLWLSRILFSLVCALEGLLGFQCLAGGPCRRARM